MTSRSLMEAIDYADPERLRLTLKNICERSAIARDLVGTELLVDSRSSSEDVPLGFEAPQVAPAVISIAPPMARKASSPNKRPFIRYSICGTCGKEFETLHNNHGDCTWHEGFLEAEIEQELWDEHCEDAFGLVDRERNRREHPNGWVWSGCGCRGDSPACRRGPHTARDVSCKKLRVES
ncbi:hypothetical protein HDK77DRAFT_176768 [Phyllosticta capitalensis]|uniref:C2H2-type domain-containing protein n=1 Tax=Phyllosticta capitalensis TaxID=121624 RepID=A0ABR1YUQ5_9PEZI